MNQLDNRAQFETILADYHLSAKAKTLLSDMTLVLLSGPSAAGRNTIIEQLMISGGYQYIVSDTTRNPRLNNGVQEKNGVNYWFRTESELMEDLIKGDFLEAEIIHNQQVSGISMRELNKAFQSGQIALSEVEIGGFNNIASLKPDTIGIFVLPPSFSEWLIRLEDRSQMPEIEVISRLKTGVRIFREIISNPRAKIVVNSVLSQSVELIDDIVHKRGDCDSVAGRRVANNLLIETEAYLSKK